MTAMIRFASDELILRDGTVLCIGAGSPGASVPVIFESLREMNRAIVVAVFEEFMRRGKGTTTAYWRTAEELGYEGGSAVQKIIGRKRD